MDAARRFQVNCIFAVFLFLLAGFCSALEFEMQTQTKCIFEEMNANVIVVGDYKAANRDNPSLPIYMDVKVRAWVAYLSPFNMVAQCCNTQANSLCFFIATFRCLIQQEK